MRISGGVLKGRVVRCPKGTIRPAMDKMRESIFAILGDLSDKSFLDLFSGSGTVALEAVSRGAFPVEAVEKDRIKTETLLQNVSLSESEMKKRIHCHFMPVEIFVKRCKNAYDIIFCDPPFPYQFHQNLVESIAKRKLLTADGLLLIHRPSELAMPDTIDSLALSDRRIYGRSVVDFYRYASDKALFTK